MKSRRTGIKLPALLASGGLEGLHGGDMEVGKERPPVSVREGDENAVLAQGNGIRVAHVVGIAAGELDPKRLEGFAAEQSTDFVAVHTVSVPQRHGRVEPPVEN